MDGAVCNIRKHDAPHAFPLWSFPFPEKLTFTFNEVARIECTKIWSTTIHPVDIPFVGLRIVGAHAQPIHRFNRLHAFPKKLDITLPMFNKGTSIQSRRDRGLCRQLQPGSILPQDFLLNAPITYPEVEGVRCRRNFLFRLLFGCGKGNQSKSYKQEKDYHFDYLL